MKKENIQSRNRKLSAKARKKHSTFPAMNHHHPGVNPATASLDMLKPLEKMYNSSDTSSLIPNSQECVDISSNNVLHGKRQQQKSLKVFRL